MSFLQRMICVAAALVAVSMAAPTTFSSMSYVANVRIHPFAEMPLPNYYMLDGATVAIEYGFNSGYDQLLLDYQGDFPISATFSSQTGILYLSGNAPISEYSAAIQSVVFVTSASDGDNRVITFTYGMNTTYSTSTEHFYRYVQGTTAPWSQAADDCAQRPYMGMQGYLATITSEREMLEVVGRSTQKTWLGAMPNATGAWYWITGPEGTENGGKGRLFWVGEDIYNGGQTPTWLSFEKWYPFTPNGAGNATYLVGLPPVYQNVAYMGIGGPNDGIQGWICEYGGLDNAAVAATTWQYTTSMTLQFDCSLFDTTSDCVDHAAQGCSWSSGSCKISDCSRYLLQSSCVGDWRCGWFVNGEVGVCANTECSQYANQAACSADPSCYYRSMQCLVASCRNLGSSCTCGAMDGCTWHGGKCFADASVGCSNMDVVYLIDGTVNMSQAFERYPNGFVGITQGLVDADLSLTGTPAARGATSSDLGSRVAVVVFGSGRPQIAASNVGSGGRLTGLNSELRADVRYLQQLYTASATTRQVGPAILEAINMLKTTTGRQRVIVVVSSAGISDAQSISMDTSSTGVLGQLAAAQVTLLGVTLRQTEPQTPDSMAASASLAMLTTKTISTTMTNVFTQVLYGICSNQPLTLGVYFPKTISICANYGNEAGCMQDSRCSWDYAGKSCSNTRCLQYCTSTTCNADAGCAFSGTQCGQRCASPPYTAGATSCGTASACMWSSTSATCIPKACVGNPTEDSCIADPYGCIFQNGACAVPECQAADITTCVASTATNGVCTFSPTGNCFFSPCQTTNATRCGLFPQCWWSSGKCSLNPCGLRYQTEMTCMADRNCAWSTGVSPAVCQLAPCSGLNFNTDPQGSCATNPACYWQPKAENGFQDMCVVRPCYANQRSCDCAAQSDCVWTNNTCKDTTFVQCPAMDVVFLIEATTPMSNAFGRHPNGFSGIVESIRSWGQTVPMSPTAAQSGFRLAIVGYGSSTRALQPAEGPPIFGTNFTNNATLWSGPQLILDNFANNQPTYGDIAGSDVAIFQGLKAAASLFENFGHTNRKKLLIVFGHGVITDGEDDQVSDMMAELDGMGVEVFSNVVRRFSVITPAETMAAEYLRPLASDPVETHYSFSTIDEMQSNILESFCDPSTTIGEALGISRDGTLPCNWLTGSAECNVQGSCYWNSSALPTCPLAGQCPNLGCVSLPPALAAQFECKHCEYMGGAFSCDRSKNFAPAAGVCLQTPCSANCASTSCSGSCTWDQSATRCQRAMCTATTPAACNADLGCVWSGGNFGSCQLSICGNTRTAAGCQSLTTDGFDRPCTWNTTLTPAVCVQSRCPMMDQVVCNQFPANCEFSAIGGSCVEKLCQYTDAELCSSDSGCYWNPYVRVGLQFGSCNARERRCILTDSFSSWSPCTANCGSGAVRYRSKAIVQFPQEGGRSCADVAGAAGLSQSEACNASTIATWSSDCNSYCSQYDGSVTSCITDISCQWANLRCVPRPVSGCAALATSAACGASDMCAWNENLQFCEDAPQACRFDEQPTCNVAPSCVWRTGSNTNHLASALGLAARLVNPGQLPVHPFSALSINSNDIFHGASVTIENGYQLGKDVLEMTYPTTIQTMWVPSSGTLQLSGAATASEYGYVIRGVTFYTSSMRSTARNVTWTLGNQTLFSLSTGHYYRYYPAPGTSWVNAKFACAATSHYGIGGYLATITSTAENSLVSNKMGADGWMSGDDASRGQWQLSTGPESGSVFWIGGSTTSGGYAATGGFANWNDMDGQPKRATSQISHVYLNQSGYWSAKVDNDPNVAGYICEYGGQLSDLPTVNYPIAGGTVVGTGGCLPTTPCVYHGSLDLCNADSQCTWYKNGCIVGCGTYSTIGECSSGTNCIWDTTVLPPVCSPDTCSGLGKDACSALTQCTFQSSSGCTLKTGCAQYQTPAPCNTQPSCTWSGTPGECGKRPCNALTTQSTCTNNPLCQWSQVTGCSTVLCKYGSASECSSDASCVWSLPETNSVEFYAGGQKIAPFSSAPITSPTDGNLLTDGITVMVTKGFQMGDDVLTVDRADNIGNSWIVSWNSQTGVLTLRVAPGVQMRAITAFAQMKSMVKFYSASSTLIRRTLLYVLAFNTYASATTGMLYRSLPSTFVNTYAKAAAVCSANTLLGVPGTLAVIVSQQDNLAIRSLGASGFIGATNSMGSWSWLFNTSTTFWTGSGSNGAVVNGQFSSWSAGEPLAGNAFAALNPSGSWKSVPSSNVVNFGVVCQYAPPANQVVSSTYRMKPAGCFARPCIGLPIVSCSSDPQCTWVNAGSTAYCAVDSFCSVATDLSNCLLRQQCYWDFVYGSCRSKASSVCTVLSQTSCSAFSQCAWTSATVMVPRNGSALGFCRSIGCSSYPNMDSCTGDPQCLWSQIGSSSAGQCVGRVCGYTTSSQCWSDATCQWDPKSTVCSKSACASFSVAACNGQCQFDAATGVCSFKRCSDPDRLKCLSDNACLYSMAQGCYMTNCLSFPSKETCEASAQCYYSYSTPQQCIASQCMSLENATACGTNAKTCAWSVNPAGTAYCKELSFLAQFAPSTKPNTCTVKVFSPPWWLWIIMVGDFALLVAILYRIYLAFSAGLTFFNPVRRTKKYDYSQYAADLFQDAKDFGIENNGVNYGRPSLNDL